MRETQTIRTDSTKDENHAWHRDDGRQIFAKAFSPESQSLILISEVKILVSSIKVEVKEKHISFGWNFSCFAAHLIKQDLF